MAHDTISQLPGEGEILDIPPQDVVLSFSRTKEEQRKLTGKDGVGKRLGYWRILRRRRDGGKSAVYYDDLELNAQLRQMTGEEQPSWVPMVVYGNPIPDPSRPEQLTIPDTVIFRELAWYAGHKPICRCATANELNRMAERAVTEQEAGPDGKSRNRIISRKPYPCRARQCPDLIAGKCKPHIVLNCYLPWAAGQVCKFRSSGWTSFGAMRSSLLDIAKKTGGWLQDLPLEMIYDEEQVGDYWVPQIRFRLSRTMAHRALEEGQRLLQLVGSNTQQAMQVTRLQQQARQSIVRFTQDPGEQAAFQAEFHPEQAAVPTVLEGEFTPEPAADEGESFELQSPPETTVPDLPDVEEIVDRETFNAAMIAAGVTTPDEMQVAKKHANLAEYKLNQLDLDALRTIYVTRRAEVEP